MQSHNNETISLNKLTPKNEVVFCLPIPANKAQIDITRKIRSKYFILPNKML